MKTAFIGSGNMARAIIGGMVASGTAPKNIAVINPGNAKSTAECETLYGVVPACSEALESAEVIVLAVKPQSFPVALPEYSGHVNPSALIISIMAGVAISTLEGAFPQNRVIRVMPNLNLSVGKGATGIALGALATEADGRLAEEIFSASGIVVRVTEPQLDDVAALSGSGSAYLYYLVEALRDVAIEDGIAPETAAALANQTLIGAARLLEQTGEPPEELRRRITSKKGTTDAAIRKMTELGFPEAVKAGYRANKTRSAELSAEAAK
ncbi:MAG: pyrroline-5-carboxylate reductase [Oscillospiraceae bacterium]